MKKKYPKLKKYIKGLDFDDISTKNLIFICRTALNRKYYELNNKEYDEIQNEVLELFKSKDWSWYARDIDNNILLTYPVLHGHKDCVQYLLENKYDVKEYNPTVSGAICACVSLLGNNLVDYFLSIEMNQKYKNDMLSKAYNFLTRVKDTTDESVVLTYQSIVDKLIHKVDFTEVLEDILLSSNRNTFHHFLFNHPLDTESKVHITHKIMDNYSYFGFKNSDIQSKEEMFKKYEVFAELQKMKVGTEEKKKPRKI